MKKKDRRRYTKKEMQGSATLQPRLKPGLKRSERNMPHTQVVKDKLKLLPDKPGCYLMKDSNGIIIYIGKAKVLKNRVRSYFTGSHSGKTLQLVMQISDFDLIITKSEAEALLLESNLIKAHKPKYNILLKDDKSYPFIALTTDEHTRLIITRQPRKKYKALYGPYSSASSARAVVDMLNFMYPLRKCKILPKKECLYYHIGQCLAPCILPITQEEYEPYVEKVQQFLKGDTAPVINDLKARMSDASERMEYERALEFRDMLNAVDMLVTKQTVHMKIDDDVDIFAYSYDDVLVAIQVFHVRGGKLVTRESTIAEYFDDPIEVFYSYILQFYNLEHVMKPKMVYLDKALDISTLNEALDLKIIQPQRGEKKNLVDLATENAAASLEQKKQLYLQQVGRTLGAVEQLGELLGIATPTRIEIFDTANLGNDAIVSAVVVFHNGEPSKRDYRRYKIQSIKEQDDYGALREVLYRRYYRMMMEDKPLPQLIIVDGGIGHVNVAREQLAQLNINIPVVGLAKNDRHKTTALVGLDNEKINLKEHKELFYMLSNMQEEVHRFVIDYHRKLRTKLSLNSRLDHIPGIGEQRKKLLLTTFGSLNKIMEATVDDLAAVIPLKLAQEVYNYLQSDEE
ncbi:excinuclease ABC subunit UvrC [Culicoidibacter larvae]|uniref:UvrABC system protein C n=1 Tax=Culicoidibacter larvae TaxID=2579976 RepID=A0A5R8Q8D7_9FIRM|nr:excinuclease ABC subunit UvrC [Culicoidibacter larvae]TLG71761.1 excinuclease ABC subunit UvrC [Culicoidibacter larvae]